MTGKTPRKVDWTVPARARVLEMARDYVDDDDIVGALCDEFPSLLRGRPQALKRRAAAEKMVRDMEYQIDNARASCRAHIAQRLREIGDSEAREALTATTWRAREILGHAQTVDIRTKQLAKLIRGYTPEQVRALLRNLVGKTMEPKDNVLTLGGGK